MKGFLASVKGKIIATAVSAAVIGSAVTAAVFINIGYRIISVKALTGTTQIQNEGKESYAYEGLHLKKGDDVKVNTSSDLTLSLDEDKYVYAEADTHFWIEAARKTGNTRTIIHLDEGSQLFRIDNKLSEDEFFDVQTPNAIMSVRGTVFRVTCRYNEDGELITTVEVFEGEVSTEPVYKNGANAGEKTGEQQIIPANHKAKVRADDTVSEFVLDDNEQAVAELDISDYSELAVGAGKFLGTAIDEGRDICISKSKLYDYVDINECIYELRHDEVASTCTEQGHYYPKCSVCEKVSNEIVMLPLVDHIIVEEDVPGSICGEAGIRYRKCSVCETVVEEIALEPREHEFDEGRVVKKPTSKSAGLMTYTCVSCGASKEETIPATTDSVQVKNDESKVSEADNTSTPANKQNSNTPSTAKTPSSTKTSSQTQSKTPTQTQGTTCSKGHTYVEDASKYKAPTCITEGLKYSVCSSCGDIKKVTITKLDHDYRTDASSSFAATCTADGKIVKKCSMCGDKITTTIDSLGHDLALNPAKTVVATCKVKGSETYECSRCSYVDVRDTAIDPDNHNYVCVSASAHYIATKNKYMHNMKCSRCADIKEEDCVFTGNVCVCGYNKASKPETTLKSGSEINTQLNDSTFLNGNAIETIKRSDTIPAGVTYKNIAKDGEVPVNIWVDNKGVLNFHSEAKDIVISNGERLFSRIHTLKHADLSFMKFGSTVTSLQGMFEDCSALESVDLSSFDTSNITNTAWMFSGCNNLTGLDLTGFNTSNVTDMGSMFEGCSKLTTIDVSNFNTSKVTSMTWMFSGCSNLTGLDLTSFDTSKVIRMRSMFEGCSKLTTLDLSGFVTTSVTNMEKMFYNCTNLETIYANSNFTVTKAYNDSVKNTSNMFTGATKLKGGKGTTLSNSGLNTSDSSTGAYLSWVDGKTLNDPFSSEKTALNVRGKGLFTEKGSQVVAVNGPSMSESSLKDFLGDAMDYNIVANDLTVTGNIEASFATKELHGNTSLTMPRDVSSGKFDHAIIGLYDGSELGINEGASGSGVLIYTTQASAEKFGSSNIKVEGGVVKSQRSSVYFDFQYSESQLKTKVGNILGKAVNVSNILYNCADAYSYGTFAEEAGGVRTIDITGIGDTRFDGSAGTYVFNLSTGEYNTLFGINIKKNDDQIIVFNIPDTNVKFDEYKFDIYNSGASIGSGTSNASISQENITKTVIFNAPNATSASFEGPTNGVFLIPNASGWTLGSVAAGWLYTNSATVGGIEWHGLSANKPAVKINDASLTFHVKNTLQNVGTDPSATLPEYKYELYETDSTFRHTTGKLIDAKYISSYMNKIGEIDFNPIAYSGYTTAGTNTLYYVIREPKVEGWTAGDSAFAHIKVVLGTTTTTVDGIETATTTVNSVEFSYTLDENRIMESPVSLGTSTPQIEFTNVRDGGRAGQYSFEARVSFEGGDDSWPDGKDIELCIEPLSQSDVGASHQVSATAPMPDYSNVTVTKGTTGHKAYFGDVAYPYDTPAGESEFSGFTDVDGSIVDGYRCYMYKVTVVIPAGATSENSYTYDGVKYDTSVHYVKVFVEKRTDPSGNRYVATHMLTSTDLDIAPTNTNIEFVLKKVE